LQEPTGCFDQMPLIRSTSIYSELLLKLVIHLDVCYLGRRSMGSWGLGPGNNLGKIGAQQQLDPIFWTTCLFSFHYL